MLNEQWKRNGGLGCIGNYTTASWDSLWTLPWDTPSKTHMDTKNPYNWKKIHLPTIMCRVHVGFRECIGFFRSSNIEIEFCSHDSFINKISGKWFPPTSAFFAKRSFSTKPPYFRRGNISTISQEKPLNCWSEYINHLPRALMPPTKLWHDRYLISVIKIFFDLESCAFRNSWGKWRNSQIAVPVPRPIDSNVLKVAGSWAAVFFLERLLVVVVTYDMWYIEWYVIYDECEYYIFWYIYIYMYSIFQGWYGQPSPGCSNNVNRWLRRRWKTTQLEPWQGPICRDSSKSLAIFIAPWLQLDSL